MTKMATTKTLFDFDIDDQYDAMGSRFYMYLHTNNT